MDDDFDSSDLEFDAPAPDRFSSAGSKSITAIKKNASALRIESKLAVKQLQSVHGAPGSRRQRSQWARTWEAFFKEVLKKNHATVPCGQDIERFILSLPSIMESSSTSREAIAWSTLVLALRYTFHAIRCRHDTFALSYNDKQRIKDCFETLRMQEKITKDPVREAQWLTTRLMAHLIRGLLVKAVRFGVLDWSIVVQKALGLALQSALSSRVGEVAVSRDYDDDECLAYKDIELKVTVDDTSPVDLPLLDRVTLDAKVTLRYTKGFKRDGSHNHIIVLSSLDSVEFNVVDPLKLLLAHALRHDCFYHTTAEDVVQEALTQRDGVFRWKYPERPVLCALKHRKFQYDKGASTQLLRETLNEAAQLSGITQRLVTHDIRRGAALEASQLPPRRNMEGAAEALGHSNFALMSGVTAKYVGHNTRSTLADRISVYANNDFGLAVAEDRIETTLNKRKVSSNDIDDYLAQPENTHLKKLKVPRHAATRALIKQRSSVTAPKDQDRSDQIGLDKVHPRTPLQPLNQNKLKGIAPQSTMIDLTVSDDEKSDGSMTAAHLTRETRRPVDTTKFDPALLLLSGLPSTRQAQGNADPGMVPDTSILEARLDEMDFGDDASLVEPRSGTAAQVELEVLEASQSEFIAWLSQINTRVVNDTNPAQHKDLDHLRGGSRDEPTFFSHRCCKYATTSGPSMNYHEAICTTESRKSANTKLSGFSKACDVPGCSYVARGEKEANVNRNFNSHKTNQHPKPGTTFSCPIGGGPNCAGPFKSKDAVSHHKTRHHSNIVPQGCPVDGCTSKKLWSSAANLEDHIRKGHLIKGKALSALINAAKARGVDEESDEGSDEGY
ncbi:hypothetical protein SNOG_10652 [Parastagonospora nodorum SN15]|uniref:C2H2-type domain-containing protein n=1 Tax=Phaeosphaeria nodorum (strain SN15 / ATCC MYA-4574 / FGSC 10173) TaxID=321614 RepID=Q0UC62_PHANO|nr:hypothetical protein SNOG_10652 [Parastagonospora nodorum SN15]EAT82046.1 hypothetical protein SNOG_10652 [Parastagonospora nodorum SN15]